MQSETLLALIGKIRVQRVRLNPSTSSSLPTPWTYQEEFKLEEVSHLSLSSSIFMALTSHYCRATFLRGQGSSWEESAWTWRRSVRSDKSEWRWGECESTGRTISTRRFWSVMWWIYEKNLISARVPAPKNPSEDALAPIITLSPYKQPHIQTAFLPSL